MPIRRLAPLALAFVLSAARTPSAAAQEPTPTPPRPAEPVSPQSRTVDDIRNVGTAMFAWLVDQVNDGTEVSAVPEAASACISLSRAGGACKLLAIDRLPLISYQELTQLLVPGYIDAIPEKDGWGTPYEFRLDRKNVLSRSVMAIRSAGADHAFSGFRYHLSSFLPAETDQDFVWLDGFFIRRPRSEKSTEPH